jgi:hypothetical protein
LFENSISCDVTNPEQDGVSCLVQPACLLNRRHDVLRCLDALGEPPIARAMSAWLPPISRTRYRSWDVTRTCSTIAMAELFRTIVVHDCHFALLMLKCAR